ncbi:MAG TPA: class I poly(R)-hydroxyalkanoic acid synthase, partial [Burkholderiales bacterium]|nr:class I poly(R)-hydroxyalkanoic acid synthase [Burkholderiales bacterium]
MSTPSDSNAAAWQALIDTTAGIQQQLLSAITQPFSQGAGTLDAGAALQQLADDYARNPERWQQLQQSWYQQQRALWTTATSAAQPGTETPAPDRRFRAPEWREPYFHWLAQSYLVTARWLTALADDASVDAAVKRKTAFLIRQWVDAASPANYAWSNPEALKLATETQGASLAQGLQNLRDDLPKGMVSMTDERAFEVGRNLAVTPGAVVFENDLMQLIQYRPTTQTVHERPLLMVPPCINKFYILDLQPENSLVRYAVEQGHTVFMVSWRNASPAMGKTGWDGYIAQGVIAAIDATRKICGVKKISALGFCVGGTMLATAIAVLRAKRKNPVASLTLLATMLDFCDTGELSVFIDEAYVQSRERQFAHGGILPGRELAITFASLRANDLIWNYVVNNYLKGKTPEPFDLLYWNSDSTNLPGAMYAWYVRNTYLDNTLCVPGKLTVCGVPLNLPQLDLPTYLLATREDHIVPWKTAYASTQLLQGKQTFVLAASGHIAGVINPAARDKRNYWTNGTASADADVWLAG